MNNARDGALFMKLKVQSATFWLSKEKFFFSRQRKDKQKQPSIAIGDRSACQTLRATPAVQAVPLSNPTLSANSFFAALRYQP